jgi:hypothetical protein
MAYIFILSQLTSEVKTYPAPNPLLIKQTLQGMYLEFEVKVHYALLACCMSFSTDHGKRESYGQTFNIFCARFFVRDFMPYVVYATPFQANDYETMQMSLSLGTNTLTIHTL